MIDSLNVKVCFVCVTAESMRVYLSQVTVQNLENLKQILGLNHFHTLKQSSIEILPMTLSRYLAQAFIA